MVHGDGEPPPEDMDIDELLMEKFDEMDIDIGGGDVLEPKEEEVRELFIDGNDTDDEVEVKMHDDYIKFHSVRGMSSCLSQYLN